MNYNEYLTENLDENIKYSAIYSEYSEYLAEKENIKYSEYIAENLDLGFETESQKAKRIRFEREKKLKRIYGNSI